jgi:hypothetical protein
MSTRFSMVPELQASQWFNTETPLSLSGFHGKVVVVEAFLHEYDVRFPIAADAASDARSVPFRRTWPPTTYDLRPARHTFADFHRSLGAVTNQPFWRGARHAYCCGDI